MVDRTLMREIKKLTGDGSREAKFALLHKVDAAAKDLADHPRDRFQDCIKTHDRAVVAICVAATLYERRDRLDRWQLKWAQEVLDIIPGWTDGNRRRAYIDDWEMHPTAICDYAGKTIKLWTEQ